MSRKIDIFTDASGNVNNKTSGWGCVILIDGVPHEFKGRFKKYLDDTTILEGTAVTNAIHCLLKIAPLSCGDVVQLFSDNHFVVATFHSVSKKPLHIDKVIKQMKPCTFNVFHIKGHNKHPHNSRSDALAREGSNNG